MREYHHLKGFIREICKESERNSKESERFGRVQKNLDSFRKTEEDSERFKIIESEMWMEQIRNRK